MDRLETAYHQRYAALIHSRTGIHIADNKRQLLETRLSRILYRKHIESPEAYLRILENPANEREFQEFVDAMTTNTTEFFRENHHFEFLRQEAERWMDDNPRIRREREIRIWSAGCSTGQEPVTLRMLMEDLFGDEIRVILLATDISQKVLKKAVSGCYSDAEAEGIPQMYLKRHFRRTEGGWQLDPAILKEIRYRHFNLMEPFPFRKGFDIIFCRNVMIYFDLDTQQSLVTKFYNALPPGGLLFIGHSESLVNKRHHFRHLGPSLYQR